MGKAEDIDLGQLVVSSVTSFVKRRPVTISTWIFGLLVAALGTGFTVSDDKVENYGIILQQAKDFESKEFSKALRELQARPRLETPQQHLDRGSEGGWYLVH